jgi:succinate-acetate transporter protein
MNVHAPSDGDLPRGSGELAGLTRIVLRPIGSPLPLGILALVPAGVLLGVLQLGGMPVTQTKTVALLLLGFVVPLQLIAAVFSFLARDTVAGTGLAVFGGTWLATALALMSGQPGERSQALGVFLLCIGATMVVLIGGAAFGKLGPALVITCGAARFLVAGLYELVGGTGLEHAGAIIGLAMAGVALYSAVATEIEDVRGELKLPLGRRHMAREAFEGSFARQLERIEREAGVRQQL